MELVYLVSFLAGFLVGFLIKKLMLIDGSIGTLFIFDNGPEDPTSMYIVLDDLPESYPSTDSAPIRIVKTSVRKKQPF